MTDRPVIPSVADATRRVEIAEAEVSVNEEILAVAEDFAHYVASRSRGITVATPARRRLREDIERVVLAFVRSAEPPSALDKRAEARVEEIVRQAMSSITQPPEDQSLRTRNEQDPPPPPPDTGLGHGGPSGPITN